MFLDKGLCIYNQYKPKLNYNHRCFHIPFDNLCKDPQRIQLNKCKQLLRFGWYIPNLDHTVMDNMGRQLRVISQ